jgi:hypothetical protein
MVDSVERQHAIKGPVGERQPAAVSANKLESLAIQIAQQAVRLTEHGVVVIHAGQVQTSDFSQEQVGIAAGADSDIGSSDLVPIAQSLPDEADGFDIRRADIVIDFRDLCEVLHRQNSCFQGLPRDDR